MADRSRYPEMPGELAPVADEGADELREALEQFLYDYGAGQPGPAADALLAGPLAPLLAKVQAVEALADERTGHGGWVSAQALRRALDGTR